MKELPINVLSLFDGISCGQIALERAGIEVGKYFASEIKKNAIKVTQANYPNTIQLGDVTKIKGSDLPKIDLLIGGSPCQDFSAANMERLGLEGSQSSLFYEWVRILRETKATYFLLENVGSMDSKDSHTITRELGVPPVQINSSLVSAQMRDRLYWTNIPGLSKDLFGSCIGQPKDKGIKLQDILTSGYCDKDKARCLLVSDSRPLRTPAKMWRRTQIMGFPTLIFESPDLDWQKGIRYLNQVELERCQTLPEGYTKLLNRDKAADVIGDGWTVDVITHIFQGLPRKNKKECFGDGEICGLTRKRCSNHLNV